MTRTGLERICRATMGGSAHEPEQTAAVHRQKLLSSSTDRERTRGRRGRGVADASAAKPISSVLCSGFNFSFPRTTVMTTRFHMTASTDTLYLEQETRWPIPCLCRAVTAVQGANNTESHEVQRTGPIERAVSDRAHAVRN